MQEEPLVVVLQAVGEAMRDDGALAFAAYFAARAHQRQAHLAAAERGYQERDASSRATASQSGRPPASIALASWSRTRDITPRPWNTMRRPSPSAANSWARTTWWSPTAGTTSARSAPTWGVRAGPGAPSQGPGDPPPLPGPYPPPRCAQLEPHRPGVFLPAGPGPRPGTLPAALAIGARRWATTAWRSPTAGATSDRPTPSRARWPAPSTPISTALTIQPQDPGQRPPRRRPDLEQYRLGLRDQGKVADAQQHYRRALELLRKAYGEEHPDVATCLNNFGHACYRQGEYAQALTSYRQALAIRRKVLGPEHPDVATCLNNLGVLAVEQGDIPTALDQIRQAWPSTARCWESNIPGRSPIWKTWESSSPFRTIPAPGDCCAPWPASAGTSTWWPSPSRSAGSWPCADLAPLPGQLPLGGAPAAPGRGAGLRGGARLERGRLRPAAFPAAGAPDRGRRDRRPRPRPAAGRQPVGDPGLRPAKAGRPGRLAAAGTGPDGSQGGAGAALGRAQPRLPGQPDAARDDVPTKFAPACPPGPS